jgi:serine/threonine protein kinase
VWAIGITMYEVITLHNPFKNKTDEEIEKLLLHGEYPIIVDKEGFYDTEMIKIINSMLSVFVFYKLFLLLTTINF